MRSPVFVHWTREFPSAVEKGDGRSAATPTQTLRIAFSPAQSLRKNRGASNCHEEKKEELFCVYT